MAATGTSLTALTVIAGASRRAKLRVHFDARHAEAMCVEQRLARAAETSCDLDLRHVFVRLDAHHPYARNRFHVGDRLSEMAIHNGTVYLAGQVPETPEKDIRGQTAEVLAAIDLDDQLRAMREKIDDRGTDGHLTTKSQTVESMRTEAIPDDAFGFRKFATKRPGAVAA